jgi:hypothetical protein
MINKNNRKAFVIEELDVNYEEKEITNWDSFKWMQLGVVQSKIKKLNAFYSSEVSTSRNKFDFSIETMHKDTNRRYNSLKDWHNKMLEIITEMNEIIIGEKDE